MPEPVKPMLRGALVQDRLCSAWADLCRQYLPVGGPDSIWRFSRETLPNDPSQGWKLHLSATALTAAQVMRAIGPFLTERGVLYKAPGSLDEVSKLNAGIFYGYSQIGKVFTVYTASAKDAQLLARNLHRLTRGITAPNVPFDLKYRPESCVHYRYGAFKRLEIEANSGDRVQVIRGPGGNAIPDVRDRLATPDWVKNPFVQRLKKESRNAVGSPIRDRFKAFQALSQRGKGGVYLAIDSAKAPPVLCVLKEGRRHGEVEWDGRDGYWRVQHEAEVTASLAKAGLNVPQIYSSFAAEKNFYLVTEFVEGENLEHNLIRRPRRLSLEAALSRGCEVARLLSNIHAAGWVWRDCKPRNIIIDRMGKLRPIDFEGACPVDKPDPLPWGTSSYIAPEATAREIGESRLPEDLYALGVIIYLLAVGRTPDSPDAVLLAKSRSRLPSTLIDLVTHLTARDPRRRPSAETAAQELDAIRRQLPQRKLQNANPIRRARSANLESPRKSSKMGSTVRYGRAANRTR